MSKSMTPERAIEVITNAIQNETMTEEKDVALAVAQKALEYRIPKKPISIKNDEDVRIGAGTWKAGVTIYKCPCCNSFISRSSDFCPKCGQSLDWSDAT